MSYKPPLKTSFEYSGIAYHLMYIPGLPASADPRYAVPPAMEGANLLLCDCTEVTVPQGKMYVAWRMDELPFVRGFSAVPRRFLSLQVLDHSVDAANIPLRAMVCYAMQPVQGSDVNPIQSIVNILLGLDSGTGAKHHDQVDAGWVDSMFSMPETGNPTGEQGADTSNGGGVA